MILDFGLFALAAAAAAALLRLVLDLLARLVVFRRDLIAELHTDDEVFARAFRCAR